MQWPQGDLFSFVSVFSSGSVLCDAVAFDYRYLKISGFNKRIENCNKCGKRIKDNGLTVSNFIRHLKTHSKYLLYDYMTVWMNYFYICIVQVYCNVCLTAQTSKLFGKLKKKPFGNSCENVAVLVILVIKTYVKSSDWEQFYYHFLQSLLVSLVEKFHVHCGSKIAPSQ